MLFECLRPRHQQPKVKPSSKKKKKKINSNKNFTVNIEVEISSISINTGTTRQCFFVDFFHDSICTLENYYGPCSHYPLNPIQQHNTQVNIHTCCTVLFPVFCFQVLLFFCKGGMFILYVQVFGLFMCLVTPEVRKGSQIYWN